MPEFHFNLIFVTVNRLLLDFSISLTFHKHCCTLQDLKSKRLIPVVEVKGNLYILNPKSFHSDVINKFLSETVTNFACNALQTSFSSSSSSSLWHQRLGHFPLSVINHVPYLKSLVTYPIPLCDTCHLSKQSRLLFPTSTTVHLQFLNSCILIYGGHIKLQA